MNSKQRVKTTFNFGIPDRVPLNYMCNPGIDAKLKEHFNLAPNDDEGLRLALNIDFRMIEAPYIGKKMFEEVKDRKVDPLYGFRSRYIEHQTGGYYEYCDFPLLNASLEEVQNWNFPNPDDFDYGVLEEQVSRYKDFGIVLGNNGMGLVMCRLGFLRGFENALVDLIMQDEAGLLIVEKFLDFQFGYLERAFCRVGKSVDVLWMGEDLGTQIAPLISMNLFETQILSRQKRFFDLAAAYNVPPMLHTCGCSSWSYDKYIETGLKAVDTLQPEATDMQPQYLKDRFGGRLVFHGCISTAGVLTYGTPDDVSEDVKQTLEIMMPGGGYCLAPTHRIQDNTPMENALTMYESALKYGKY